MDKKIEYVSLLMAGRGRGRVIFFNLSFCPFLDVGNISKSPMFTTVFYLIFSVDLDFSFMEMNPFTLVNGEPYPLDMRGELDDTAAFKNFKKFICFLAFVFSDMLLSSGIFH